MYVRTNLYPTVFVSSDEDVRIDWTGGYGCYRTGNTIVQDRSCGSVRRIFNECAARERERERETENERERMRERERVRERETETEREEERKREKE